MNAAAVAALHGIEPLSVLSIRDPVEQLVMRSIVERCETLANRRASQMASAVVMGLAYLLSGGKGG